MPSSALRQRLRILRELVHRDVTQRYNGSLLGIVWMLLQPLMLLGIYSVVFAVILKVQLPPGVAVVPFLVTGLWPWTAFSEALLRSSTAVPDHAGLLAKVALPREVLPLAPLISAFALHGLGFFSALLLLWAIGKPINLWGLPAALLAYVLLAGFAAGLALALSAVQVFLRDLSQVLAQLVMLWFYLTPIFYLRDQVPQPLRPWLDLNPAAPYFSTLRYCVLGIGASDWLAMALISGLSLLVGAWLFHRLAPHFEDFL